MVTQGTLCGVVAISFAFVTAIMPADAGPRSSVNYSILTDTIDAGGVNGQSANYSLRGSAVGEFGTAGPGSIASTDYIDKLAYVGQLSDLLTLAGSRLIHNGTPFSVNLPLNGTSGIECRSSSIYTVVFTFASTLTSAGNVNATATGVTQPGPSSGQIDPNDAHNYIANLTALPNAQYITVTLSNVNDSDGNVSTAVPVTMGLLIGDTTGNRVVNSSDVAQTQSQSGRTVTVSNFREDVTVNGSINSSDISVVQSMSGTGLP